MCSSEYRTEDLFPLRSEFTVPYPVGPADEQEKKCLFSQFSTYMFVFVLWHIWHMALPSDFNSNRFLIGGNNFVIVFQYIS